MKNSWNKVVAMILAAALCVSCGVTGFAEDTQTDENTEVVEVVEQQNQEEPPKEEAPAPEPVQEPEPAPKEEPKEEPAPAPVKEEPKAEPAPAPVTEEPKAEPAPEAPKAEEPKKAEETKAEEPKAEEPKAEEKKTEEPKPEEKPVEQPTVPVTKVEQPAEEAPAADEVKKENITVHIEWEDEDNALGLRPTTLAVTLSGSDGQTYSAKIAEKDGWQHTFADLTTQRGAEVIYYSVDADDVIDYDKDVRGLTVTYTCTAQPVVDEQPAADDENLIDDQMDGDPAELPDGNIPTVTETEDGTVIDMGETAKEPVEGEEANADKPEEDGDLDEDFTLPEEGELPEEDAEPEIPEIDFSTLQVVIGEPQYDGDVMTLRATLIGFDNIDYALQWQFSTDDATWTDVSGATGDTLVVQLDESNAGCYWRVSAEVFGWKTLPTEQAAQE
ncbi:Cna B-type domain-containing protein [Hominenteromicrobium sp.]|uniref:Cna B-type domain-containing protein n=1 Tax=Hominenteromicrobium sp. TaxID=3073581 RepID=UPI003AF0AFB2